MASRAHTNRLYQWTRHLLSPNKVLQLIRPLGNKLWEII